MADGMKVWEYCELSRDEVAWGNMVENPETHIKSPDWSAPIRTVNQLCKEGGWAIAAIIPMQADGHTDVLYTLVRQIWRNGTPQKGYKV